MERVLQEISGYDTPYCVVTGGEPTIHRELVELTTGLRRMGKHITIETHGANFVEGVACDLASLSPKLRNSLPDAEQYPREHKWHSERRWNVDSFRRWTQSHDFQLKFVVCTEEDLNEIQDLLREMGPVEPAKVMLMPEGTDRDGLDKRSGWLARVCMEHGYRFCSRLQIELFGNVRGT